MKFFFKSHLVGESAAGHECQPSIAAAAYTLIFAIKQMNILII